MVPTPRTSYDSSYSPVSHSLSSSLFIFCDTFPPRVSVYVPGVENTWRRDSGFVPTPEVLSRRFFFKRFWNMFFSWFWYLLTYISSDCSVLTDYLLKTLYTQIYLIIVNRHKFFLINILKGYVLKQTMFNFYCSVFLR